MKQAQPVRPLPFQNVPYNSAYQPQFNQQPQVNNLPNNIAYPNLNPNDSNFSKPANNMEPKYQNSQGVYPGNAVNPNTEPIQNNPETYQEKMEKEQSTLEGSARKSFIRKVYILLCIQLIITGISLYFSLQSQQYRYIMSRPQVLITSSVLLSVLICFLISFMFCFQQAFRKVQIPMYILFTLLFAFFLSMITAYFNSETVAIAGAMTILIVVVITVYAFLSPNDIRGCWPYILTIFVLLLAFGIASIFLRNYIVRLAYATCVGFVFGIYLLYDTQVIIGKFQFQYSFDDVYIATLILYMDIIRLFIQLLAILGRRH